MNNFKPGTIVKHMTEDSKDLLGIVRLDGKIVIPPQGPIVRSSARTSVIESDENTSALVPLEIKRFDFQTKQLFDFALKALDLPSPFDQPELAGREENEG